MDNERCRATTKKGTPCIRKARYDGFCKQHARLPWWSKYKSLLISLITILLIAASLFIWDQIRSKKQSEIKPVNFRFVRVKSDPIQDYFDGLPATPDIRKKKLFENGIGARDSFKYDEARDRFSGILSSQPSPSERIAVLILIGNAFYTQRKYQEAERSYFEALSLARKHTDREGEGAALNNIGLYYSRLIQPNEATKYYKDALKIYQKIGNKQAIATTLYNLALLLRNQGNYAETESLLRQALDILETPLGKNHPYVAEIFNTLSLLLYHQGKYAEAESLLRRELDILETQLGGNHPEVAEILDDLATLLSNQGKYAEAEPLLRRELDILETQLGKNDFYNRLEMAEVLNNLAVSFSHQGKYAEAESLLRRALDICEAHRMERQKGSLRNNLKWVLKKIENSNIK